MSTFEPKPFGKYFLTERIAIGGMAEIYKAKTFGVDGFEKLIAIKKILPHFSADKEFIAMLTDEAKLVVLLSHTNIVQIYDLGKVGDDYYISMEHIDGINLREIITRGKELKKQIPLPICLFVTSEICKGLDYAHSKRDLKGQPLYIVHRDISPQNILISFDGEAKIVDFGIAKAAMNVSHTTSGILKGKITYMSPEQALGKPVDARTDIFSAGIILYELVTRERLFAGETQFEVLKKIRATQISANTLPASIPDELKPILAKSLSYFPKDRFDTAGDFQIALTRLLYTNYTDFSPKQLALLIGEWFAKELQQKKIEAHEEESISMHTKSILLEASKQKSIVYRTDEGMNVLLKDTTKPEDEIKPSLFLQETSKPEDPITAKQFKHGEEEKLKESFETENEEGLPPLPIKKKISFFYLRLLILVVFGILVTYLASRPKPEKVPPAPSIEEPKPPEPTVPETQEAKPEPKPEPALKPADIKPEPEPIPALEPNLPAPPLTQPEPENKPIPPVHEPTPKPIEPPTHISLPDKQKKPVAPVKPETQTPPPSKPPPDLGTIPSGYGVVRVDSTPRSAGVILNGRKQGITPIAIQIEKNKSHSLTVSLPGYKSWTRSFNLSQNYTEFSARLEKE